ncbi:hypothetical protein CC2G_004972 [Coprinopsis cinerea AmutBmut pab1-1]|nr:hypothetical protein CC2G_004972 [Coprinopsis cinerea AmutBmut pab1-1]
MNLFTGSPCSQELALKSQYLLSMALLGHPGCASSHSPQDGEEDSQALAAEG